MSAWDIMGAVLALPNAIGFWWWLMTKGGLAKTSSAEAMTGWLFALFFTGWATFCIARLAGAHL